MVDLVDNQADMADFMNVQAGMADFVMFRLICLTS